jgi:SAM-dependent methyltransferase
VYELLQTISIEGAPPGEMASYLREDFERFLITWDLVKDQHGRALEIGANPYFATVLLREFTDLEVTLTNSFGPNSNGTAAQSVAYASASDGSTNEHAFESHLLNVENTTFPFESDSFDVVLFCEVIEHLLLDPVVALREIKRVLRPGGSLVISTPNVARLENVARLAGGANVYDPYSGHGPYGRHNREYTRHELVRLLEFVGFQPDVHFTVDVHPHHADFFVDLPSLVPLVQHRLTDLGQYLFCRATNATPARDGYPAELFRSLPTEKVVSWNP